MKRLWTKAVALVGALAVLPLLGCVPEDGRGSGRAPSPATSSAKARATATEGPRPTPDTPPPPVVPKVSTTQRPQIPDDADPRLQRMGLVNRNLAAREERIAEAVRKVAAAVRQVSPVDLDTHDLAIEEFQKLVREMKTAAASLTSGYAEYERAMADLRRQLEAAPSAYRDAAAYCRERGKEEKREFLKRQYEGLARACDDLTGVSEKRLANHETDLKKAGEAVEDVRSAARFLDDLDKILAVWPGGDASSVRREFRKELQTFVKAFDALLGLLESYQEKLRAEAVSERLQEERVALERKKADEERRRREALEARRREAEQEAARRAELLAEARRQEEAEAARQHAAKERRRAEEARTRADVDAWERPREGALVEAQRQADEEARKRREIATTRDAAKTSGKTFRPPDGASPYPPYGGLPRLVKPPPPRVVVAVRPPVEDFFPVRVVPYGRGGCLP